MAVFTPISRIAVSSAFSASNCVVGSPPVNVTPPPSKNMLRLRAISERMSSSSTALPPSMASPSGLAHQGHFMPQPCVW